jgi:hypothetical protein
LLCQRRRPLPSPATDRKRRRTQLSRLLLLPGGRVERWRMPRRPYPTCAAAAASGTALQEVVLALARPLLLALRLLPQRLSLRGADLAVLRSRYAATFSSPLRFPNPQT